MKASAAGLFWRTLDGACLTLLMGGSQDARGRCPGLAYYLQGGHREDTPVDGDCILLIGLGVSHTFLFFFFILTWVFLIYIPYISNGHSSHCMVLSFILTPRKQLTLILEKPRISQHDLVLLFDLQQKKRKTWCIFTVTCSMFKAVIIFLHWRLLFWRASCV